MATGAVVRGRFLADEFPPATRKRLVSPALADLPVREVERVLKSLGFEHVRTKGSHAVWRHQDGRTVILPLHGTVKRGTLASIVRQAGLTAAEFLPLL
jgi:predicted RNA binding protein YcfA (HicA-like mRNA interferase family)